MIGNDGEKASTAKPVVNILSITKAPSTTIKKRVDVRIYMRSRRLWQEQASWVSKFIAFSIDEIKVEAQEGRRRVFINSKRAQGLRDHISNTVHRELGEFFGNALKNNFLGNDFVNDLNRGFLDNIVRFLQSMFVADEPRQGSGLQGVNTTNLTGFFADTSEQGAFTDSTEKGVFKGKDKRVAFTKRKIRPRGQINTSELAKRNNFALALVRDLLELYQDAEQFIIPNLTRVANKDVPSWNEDLLRFLWYSHIDAFVLQAAMYKNEQWEQWAKEVDETLREAASNLGEVFADGIIERNLGEDAARFEEILQEKQR